MSTQPGCQSPFPVYETFFFCQGSTTQNVHFPLCLVGLGKVNPTQISLLHCVKTWNRMRCLEKVQSVLQMVI